MGGSREVVDDHLFADALEHLLNEFHMSRVDLVGVLGGLVREDDVQANLVGLVDDRTMTGRPATDMKVEDAWKRL